MQSEGVVKSIADIFKGALIGVMITVIAVLILAGVLKIVSLSQTGIKTVNQFIKTMSVFLGCMVSVKNSKGLIKGLLVGTVFGATTHLIFLIMGSSVTVGEFFIDLIFCSVIGAICGIISVNVKRNTDM